MTLSTNYKHFVVFVILCAVAYVAIEDPGAIESFIRELFGEKTIEEDEETENEEMIANGLAALASQRIDERPRKKRCKSRWNWERAKKCIEEDYTGPSPIFNDRQFERVFRVTKGRADMLLSVCANSDPFFTQKKDAVTKKDGICPKVKILMALKLLAYGCSPSAFQDYFQMGESTANKCLKYFTDIISSDYSINNNYLRQMNREDAKRTSQLHEEIHGLPGMIGSLDCMHVYWRSCPTAWQGQYQGGKGKPMIILEAYADHYLWIWHATFSSPGSLNDINVWDQSLLLRSFLDGTFAIASFLRSSNDQIFRGSNECLTNKKVFCLCIRRPTFV